ncbi:lipopolysaccharide biosynthesis protein [Streptomyces sp. CAU 1734]|uniref:lipopolysaccharide biosynthesis protein n=1 Tax=Streptomyces sp. CAU 1734 TaxID=3140360 RepID=UPI003261076C
MTDSKPANPAQEAEAPVRDRRFRRSLRRALRLPRWWTLPACVLAGAVAGGAYGELATPQYTATSYAVAVPDKDAQPGAALGFAQAYGRVATSESTIAYARVAVGMPARALRRQVRTETSPDSPMIAITGTSHRPGEAADIANAVADAVFVSSNQVAKSTGVRLLSFSQAIPPTSPVSPSARITTAVGASAGGLLGGILLLVRPRRRARTAGAAAGAAVPAPAGAADAAERERV